MRLTIAMLRAVLALPAPAALAAQTGQFVVRLGRDTLAIEQYTRTADRLQGEQVVRAPRTVHRLYTVTFGPSGAAERFELVTHNVSGAPGPAETKATATFQGDSAVSTLTRSDSTRTVRAPVGAGALPYLGQSVGLGEEGAPPPPAPGRHRYTLSLAVPGDPEPMPGAVPRGGS